MPLDFAKEPEKNRLQSSMSGAVNENVKGAKKKKYDKKTYCLDCYGKNTSEVNLNALKRGKQASDIIPLSTGKCDECGKEF